MSTKNPIVLATTNKGKLSELQNLFRTVEVRCIPLNDLLPELDIPETGDTFEANAIIKARTVSKLTKLPAIADDSGLIVDALNGRPGVYSKRYGKDDESRNQKLLSELERVQKNKRTARFVSVIALIDSQHNFSKTFRGVCEGHISKSQKGTKGFGYDPVFFSDELGKTFGQATQAEKNKVSHRSRAMRKLVKYLNHKFSASVNHSN